MQKTTLLTFSLSFLVVLPAMAQLGNVWTDFQSYSVDVQNYLRNNLSETLKPLETRTQSSLTGATGDLNIPNPIAAGQQIQSDLILNSISDKFENNPAVRSASVSNEINRFLTRSSVEGVMGTNGQARLKNKLENTEMTVKNIDESVKEAEEFNRNILDQLISQIPGNELANRAIAQTNRSQVELQLQALKIQRDQSKMISETLAQTVQTNQSLQYSNLNLANISQQMEQANRARRVDGSTEAARLLRTTSQMDLFGRQTEN
ncbi:hypothetical protein I8751_00450 [Nostocaceae cyanobacterium CENA357]|uniref:Uncharacterized protein n=1 Tax=Atlanticothrix silvestris CENA357 TaxID=1725252 RepID=A0A8J7KY98_9CYAN|nr:hypothetical protein [Atlanticothrix silvestris]MBH8550886.1 hypothetical protein [Atlanticothrix silvestris CENA357]